MNIQEIAKHYLDYVVKERRHFHMNPELSGKEYETSKHIKEELDKMGIPWIDCGLETGVLATLKGGKEGKTILLRADMDALPVEELTNVEYASKNEGVMHACGHDAHAAMLLTAAKILVEMKDELPGTVKFAFQPAEESAEGAKSMIENGAMEGVESAFGIHIWSEIPVTKFSCPAGPRMAAADKFTIDIKGKGCHGAAPHQGVDAAVVAAAVINNIQSIVSRNTAPFDALVATVGTVEVGTRWNVVAENAHLEGTTRCFSKEVWEAIPENFDRIVKSTAEAFGAEAEVIFDRIVPITDNEPEMAELVRNAAYKFMGSDASYEYSQTMVGEDFAYFQKEVPGAMALLGCRNEACDAVWSHHSGHFNVDEDAMINGAMLYAQVAMDFNAK